ncbi:MAG: PAS domain S-box protein [Nitrospirae bacterium]|nr:MAG: PAS domain S-box protein [Nitrospirota bacterium]
MKTRTKEELLAEIKELRTAAAAFEHVKAEHALLKEKLQEALELARNERDKADAVIQAIGDSISIQDRDFRVLYQNNNHKTLVGDHTGEFCYMAYADGDTVCPDCAVQKAFADGRTHRHEKSRSTDRGVLHVEIIASPLRDQAGRIFAGIEAIRDITERVQMEKALEESEKRYRMLFESAVDAIFIIDAEGDQAGRIIAANRAAADMHGYTASQLQAMQISEIDSPESAAEAPALIRRILEGEWLKTELTHIRKDGSVFPVEVSAGLLELGGHKYILAVDRDISVRKRAEKEREDLIRELQQALDRINTLKGLLPICAWCKKVRDDKGYWSRVEDYIEQHSNAAFTHGICPECLKKNDPEVYEILLKNPEFHEDLTKRKAGLIPDPGIPEGL